LVKPKLVLKSILAGNIRGTPSSPKVLAEELGTSFAEARKAVAELSKEGLVVPADGGLRLTKLGRRRIKVVFIGGAFEVIHAGHLSTVEQASRLGDLLVLVVARDSTVLRTKKREPAAPEQERVRVAASLRKVDVAMLGSEKNIYETLEKVRPDIVALGYDQYHAEEDILREGRARGLRLRVVRLSSPFPGIKTSKIIAQL
jgi:FAD synthetase